ncbi:nuclear pore complex protein DDB_G0274915-like [Ylistrum balloti]|uniref:nuclear pore complex protein DDB_G0274915-like n=1 Tax=Ylistrum balloti TaxID=509963 RepID=UPI00290582B3|nr:nuclear pore complex protein DDB_G0274915-like [Ylistrum balloti]
MRLDFRILLVIFIFSLFIIYILSFYSIISFLIATFICIFILIIGRRSNRERCATKLKSPANLEVASSSIKKKKKTLSPSPLSRSKYNQHSKDISIDENMHTNGVSNSSFIDKKFDRSFEWRSPVGSPGIRSRGVASPVVGTGLRTRNASQLISRRHSFSVKSADTTTSPAKHYSNNNSRIPFLPTVKRALGLETIVSPRYIGKDDNSSYTSHPETASPGFVPAVRLSNHDRHPLSKVRSSVVRSPNTIKIAPPDPHKLGSPRVLEVRRKDPVTDENRKTPDMQSVLTALKEKRRKRTAGPAEEDTHCPEVQIQKSKRRRQESQQSNASTSSLPPLPASLPDLSVSDYNIPRLETPSLKRAAAPEVSEWEGRGNNAKRLRQEGRYNSISSSLSSSRYLERHNRSYSPRPDWSQESTAELKRAIQREINKITQEMPSDLVTSLRLHCEGAQDKNGKENADIPVSSSTQDPDSSLSALQRAETVMLTPTLEKEDHSLDASASDTSLLDQSKNKSMNTRQKVTLNKSFSVRKRQMSLYTGLNKSFSKVPKSNVVACMEDYEADREAEQRRVEQMLEDIVSSEETNKNTTKGYFLGVTNSATSTSTITPKAASSIATAAASSGVVPNLSVNSLFVSKSITTSTTAATTVKISPTQQVGQVTTTAHVPTLASSSLASPFVTPATSLVIQSSNTSVVTTPSSSMFTGLANSTTASMSATTTVASVSSGFPMGSVTTKTTMSSLNDSKSNSSNVTKLANAEAGTVGAALSSVISAVYASKSPGMFNFGQANTSKDTTAPPGGVTNVLAATVQPSLGVNQSVAGTSKFGDVNNAVATAVAPTATATEKNTPAFSMPSVNTGFPFGSATSVNQPSGAAPTPLFGNTTQSISSSDSTSGASNFPKAPTAATTFGSGAQTNQPKFTPVFGAPNPTTQANMFGASTVNPPAFGSATTTFATPQNTPAFGNPTPQAKTAPGGFNFVGGAGQTAKAPIFGGATNSTVNTTAFTTTASTAATSAFNFGTSVQTTTAASAFNFGSNSTIQSTKSSDFNFASSKPTAAVSSTFNFGGQSNAKPQTTSAFSFGGQSNQQPQTTSAFNFGGQSNPQPQTTSAFNFGGQSNPPQQTSTFNFGGQSNPQPQTTSTFNFRGQSNPTTSASTFSFGATASTASSLSFGNNAANKGGAAPAFGMAQPQVSTTSVFGGSKTQPGNAFQTGMTKSGSAPAFGDTGPSFGGGPKPSNPFGTSSTGFSGGATSAAPQAASGVTSVFGFGATTQQSSNNSSGFNFSAAGAGGGSSTFNFGGSGTPGFGAGSPAPGFGQAPGTPAGQGMFNVGASNSATKPRAMTKAKRRGARR